MGKDNQVYGPYGNLLYSANGTMGTTKGYTGQYSDPLTGLDYYVARYYDPVAGVFLSADTKEGNAQGMNPYAYVVQNPETLTDPSGKMIDCGPGCGNGSNGNNGGLGDPGAGGGPGNPGAGGHQGVEKKVKLAQQTAWSTAGKFEVAALYFAVLGAALMSLAVLLAPYLAKAGSGLLGTVFTALFGISLVSLIPQLFSLGTLLAAAGFEASELVGVYAGVATSSRRDWTSGVVTAKLGYFVPQILSNANHTAEEISNIWNALPVMKIFSFAASQIPGGQKVAQYFDAADDGRLLANYVNDNVYMSWVDEAQHRFSNLGMLVEGPDGPPARPCEMFCNS